MDYLDKEGYKENVKKIKEYVDQKISEIVYQRFYTGSGEPSSSLGNDGDIYLQE